MAAALSLSEQVIVFSGFRNEALKEAIAYQGGRVVSALSSKTTILLCQPDGKASSKPDKARALGMEILDLDAFCEQYGFDLDNLDTEKPAKKPVKPPGQAPTKKPRKTVPESVPEPVKKPKSKASKANKARASPQTAEGSEPEPEPEPIPEPVKKPKSAVLKKKAPTKA